MKVKISDIIKRVYALLDENEAIIEERVEYGDPETMLKPLIIDLLPDAAKVVILNASLEELGSCTHLKSLTPLREGRMDVVLELPPDFLRLVYVRMTDWPVGVTVPLSYGSEEYRLRKASDRLECRRRVSAAVSIVTRGELKQMEIFGTSTHSKVEQLDYVALPEISGSYIELPSGIVGAVCCKTAQMVNDVIQK